MEFCIFISCGLVSVLSISIPWLVQCDVMHVWICSHSSSIYSYIFVDFSPTVFKSRAFEKLEICSFFFTCLMPILHIAYQPIFKRSKWCQKPG